MSHLIIQFAISFNSVFGVSYVLFNMTRAHKKWLGLLLIQLAGLNYYLMQASSKQLLVYPKLFMAIIPILFLIGPTVATIFHYGTTPEFRLKWRDSIHMVLPLISALWVMSLWQKEPKEVVAIMRHLYAGNAMVPYTPITIVAGCVMLGYLVFVLIQHPRVLPVHPTPQNRSILAMCGGLIAFGFVVIISILNADLALILSHVASLGLSISSIGLVLTYFHRPGAFKRWVMAVQKKRYETSQLTYVNADDVQRDLDRLMDDETVYLDPELSLKSLASQLNLSPHQVSEYINRYKGMTFTQYINTQRIEAAKTLLISQPWRTVLSIGLDCGFNSEASFNRNFKVVTGQSPGVFRKSTHKAS